MLQRIAGLYAIESEVRGTNAGHHRAVRDEHTRAILDDLQHYLEAWLRQVSVKRRLTEVIRYALIILAAVWCCR